MIVFDTEDNSAALLAAGKSGFNKKVTQIAAICENGKRFHNQGNPLEFLKWCHEMGKEHDVWAFNCQYDIGNLCNQQKYLRLDDWDLTLVKTRFIKGKIQGINFYDVGNIAGAGNSVARLGEAVGLKKLDMDINSKEYVFRDCEIPMKWLKFVREKCVEMEIEKIPSTLGGLCVRAFETSGGQNWHEATDESRMALIGARVEIFNKGGTGRIAYVDINSLYPWGMTQLFPTEIRKLDALEGYGIASCDVEVPEMFVAPLPWRDKDGRLLFPTGKFSGIWTIHEIKNAVRAGTKVLRTHWILGSPEGKPFYRAYVLTMYERRMQATSPAENLFWKLLMNNLYGRLAIGGEISRSLLLTEQNKYSGPVYGRKVLATHKMPLPEFSNYLHAAHVLSYGRVRLFNFLKRVPPQNLIYCDTDSVIFFCQDKLPFSTGKDLGEMKLECMGSKCVPILPKTYQFDETYKAKGVPKKKAKEFITTRHAEYESPFKIRESIVFYEQDNKRKLSVWRKVEKDLNAVYDKKTEKGEFYLPTKINSGKLNLSEQNDLLDIITQ